MPGRRRNFLLGKQIGLAHDTDRIGSVRFGVSVQRYGVAPKNQCCAQMHDVAGRGENGNDALRPAYVDSVGVERLGLAGVEIADAGCVQNVGRPEIIPEPQQFFGVRHADGCNVVVARHPHIRRPDTKQAAGRGHQLQLLI